MQALPCCALSLFGAMAQEKTNDPWLLKWKRE
jgi:hypothetical protein